VRVLKWMGVVAVCLLAGLLGSVPTSAGASAALMKPGLPTAVYATAIAGVRGVTVSWNAPFSDGGSQILYYSASNYAGTYSCVSINPSSGTCHIDGFSAGTGKPHVRVRAVSSKGRGAVVVILPVITNTYLGNGNLPASPPSGTNVYGVIQTTSAASAGVPTALPFTGSDVEALFILGVSLVLGGLLVLSPLGQRRRAHGCTAYWLLQQ
jgi:hypothetical protein